MTEINKAKYNGGYTPSKEDATQSKAKQLYNFAYNCQPDGIRAYYNDVVNIFNDDGMTPLMRASYNGNIDCVKKLLELTDIKINLTDDKNRSSIFLAQFNEKIEVVNLLLSHNANIDIIPKSSNDTEESNYQPVMNRLKEAKAKEAEQAEQAKRLFATLPGMGGKRSRKRKTKKTKSKRQEKLEGRVVNRIIY
jgi:hypothetical protein